MLIRRSGFTLIEMVVTVTVLVLFAALLVPEFARMKERNLAENFFPGLQSAVRYAHNQAISQTTVTVLQFDSGSNSFTVSNDSAVDPLMPGQGQSNPNTGPVPPQTDANASVAPSPFSQNSQPGMESPPAAPAAGSITQTVQAPTTYLPSQWQLNGQQVDESSWAIRFYPDGTSDIGSVTFDYGSFEKTLVLNGRGLSQLVDGAAPDPATVSWQGGTFEARQ